MTIIEWLTESSKKLNDVGVDAPRTDTLVILEHTLRKDRAWILTNLDYKIPNDLQSKLSNLLSKRLCRIPLAYIVHKAWFYGRSFTVSSDVLIPRPETEDIITLALPLQPQKILELGTGSGCIAITCKLEIPSCEVIATDISPQSLEVAQQNADDLSVSIKFLVSDLLGKCSTLIDKKTMLIANLPYVPEDYITSPEILNEPQLALFSGADGMKHYRALWGQISKLQNKPSYILLESLVNQHNTQESLANKYSYQLHETMGLIQLFSLKPKKLNLHIIQKSFSGF